MGEFALLFIIVVRLLASTGGKTEMQNREMLDLRVDLIVRKPPRLLLQDSTNSGSLRLMTRA